MSKKNSFEESRRVWSGNGFIKFKNPRQTIGKLVSSKLLHDAIFKAVLCNYPHNYPITQSQSNDSTRKTR